MPGLLAVGMGPHHLIALGLDSPGQRFLHFLLRGPALLVGREAQVAAGDEIDLLFRKPARLPPLSIRWRGFGLGGHHGFLESRCDEMFGSERFSEVHIVVVEGRVRLRCVGIRRNNSQGPFAVCRAGLCHRSDGL